MDYEWDQAKASVNREKHGILFEDMARFDWSASLLLEVEWIGGEERELSIGPIDTGLFSVVTVERGKTVRIVSLRRATRAEKDRWRQEFQHG